jgi:hypothetical protein
MLTQNRFIEKGERKKKDEKEAEDISGTPGECAGFQSCLNGCSHGR